MPEAIPRRFLFPLQQICEVVLGATPEMPNVAFQVCLKAFFEYNEYPNSDLSILLISKYFYTLFRQRQSQGGPRRQGRSEVGLGSGLTEGRGPGFGMGGSGTVIPARLLTVDNDSDTSLETAGISYKVVGIRGWSPPIKIMRNRS